MKEEIKKIIDEVVDAKVDYTIEHPADISHGDYSTNIAMVLAKQEGKNPRDLADEISEKIWQKVEEGQSDKSTGPADDIEKVEVAGPGFINFHLKKSFFAKEIQKAIHLEYTYGQNEKLKDKNILIEFTDPNPFKQFHIGHLMSNSIGEALARIFEWNGAKVIRLSYGGDVGPHVAKTIWGMKQMRDAFPQDTDSLEDKINFLAQAYVLGSTKYEEDEATKKVIDEINKKVYELFDDTKENDDLDIEVYFQKGKTWSLQHFDEIYAKLGTSFDMQLFESSVFALGEKIVRDNTPKVFEVSEGAVIYRGEDEGLHNRVFINSLGIPTYEAKEIGLAHFKESEISRKISPFDASVIITGNEQKEYFKVVLKALEKINPEIAKKTKHLTHGMMRFTGDKMSSRKGNVITGESLISDIEEMVANKIADRDFDDESAEEVKEIISVGAIKYSILKNAIGRNIIFDSKSSISFEGDSGPYLQYTYNRAKSVVDKAAKEGIKIADVLQTSNWQATDLEKKLYRFPEVVAKAYEEFAPQQITNFAMDLASEFNSFYGNTQILDGGEDQAYKVAISKAVMYTLHNALAVLGIRVPERM